MAPPKRPGPWVLSELLGQRKLLLLGALVAWLVLFHLLVNVWLLCIFTSLLVVLGGWLGSRAALDANSVLHLEHFLPLGKSQPPLPSVEDEHRLNHEIHSAIHKAVRDFVSSWYRTLLPDSLDGEFERQVRATMLESVTELKERAQRLDRKALVQRVLELCGGHLQSYMAARKMQEEACSSPEREPGSLWRLYSQANRSPHPSLRSAAAEVSYSRALVNVVLHVLVPYPHMESPTGGYMVSELITCNLLLSVIGRMSDPDWLYQTIVDVFTKSREPQQESEVVDGLYRRPGQHESWATCCSLSTNQSTALYGLSDTDDPKVSTSPARRRDLSLGSVVSLMSAENSEVCHVGLLPPHANCLYAEYVQSSESKVFSVESLTQSESEDEEEGFCDCAPPTNFCNVMGLKDEEAPGCFAPLRSLGPKPLVVSEVSHWPAGIAQEPPPVSPPRGMGLPQPLYSFEVPNRSNVPHISIQNVQITGTSTAKEQRGNSSHPYTLYIVKVRSL